MSIDFRLADWNNPKDCDTVFVLLDSYARDPMGGSQALDPSVKEKLPRAMATTPGAFSVIGFDGAQPVSLANCFTTLSTFACKPLVNIHDLAVISGMRGRGVGQQTLAFVEGHAKELGACKVTLEVLTGNTNAMRAYESFGFKPYTLDESTGHAVFMHKTL